MFYRGVVLCALFVVIKSEVSVSKLMPKPDKFKDVEGCYIVELDSVIPFEQSQASSNECMEYRCEENWVYHASCGLAAAMPPFELVADKEKPYPECCPRLKETSD